MELIFTPIADLYILEPRVFEDDRGYFFEAYSQKVFREHGLDYNFVQDNESRSTRGVLRGLHYQNGPMGQAKLVRVTEGEVYDVAVDIREGSKTYGHHFGTVLSADNKKQMMIPRGFAHGFVVLSETAVFSYKCDNFYSKPHDRGIHPFDESLGIEWRIDKEEVLLSDKDSKSPAFGEHDRYQGQ